MSETDDKIKRLLDGDFDEEEIASDPVLASLAERIFGLTIEPMAPTKGAPQSPDLEQNTEPVSNSMIEVIPSSNLPSAPLPNVMSTPGELPPVVTKAETKSGSKLKLFGLMSLFVSIGNIFGVFGFLNSQCSADACDSEATRINWAGIHNITNELGWSMPYPEIGIPDYVAIACSIILLLVAFTRK